MNANVNDLKKMDLLLQSESFQKKKPKRIALA
jgi:hypothetical protein